MDNSIEILTKQLVKKVTKFQELEENYEICCKFALSNFKYHKFLDVNENKIKNTIEGLSTKFYVHSLDVKSDQVKQLCYKFIESEYFPVVIRYSMLSFILKMANSPISSIYHPIILKTKIKEEIFDWKTYMNGDLLEFFMPQENASDFSDSDDITGNEDCTLNTIHEIGKNLENVLNINHDAVILNNDELTSNCGLQTVTSSKVLFNHALNLKSNHAWLIDNVMPQYWSDKGKNDLRVACDMFCLSEYQVMREVLWILAGAKDSFIFIVKERKVSVRNNISLKNLNSKALKSQLDQIAYYASIVSNLQNCIARSNEKGCCRTQQAFSNIVVEKLKEFFTKIILLEKKVLLQDSITTLPLIIYELEIYFNQLSLMHKICKQFDVFLLKNTFDNSSRSCHLLNCIFKQLVTQDLAKLSNSQYLLDLWNRTFRPYLEIIDELLNNGQLKDSHSEFLILDSMNSISCDEQFWKNCYQENEFLKTEEISFLSKYCLDKLIASYKSLRLASQLHQYKSFLNRSKTSSLRQIYHQKMITNNTDTFKLINEESKELLDIYIGDKCSQICRHLVQLIKEDYQLLYYMKTIQKLYLMGSGNVMFQFSTAIYEKIKFEQVWRDETILNALLHNAIDGTPHLDINLFEINLNETVQQYSILDMFNVIELHFKVAWPINILLNTKNFVIYNKIFQYLLKIKWVKYLIEGLKYQDLLLVKKNNKVKGINSRPSNLVHRIFIMRFKLMSFINCLHNYMLTRILHHIGIHFINELKKCEDFDSIIYLHEQYISQLFERCLLQQNVARIQQVISSIMQLTLSLVKIWNSFLIKKTGEEVILEMENNLVKFFQFLSTTLSIFTQHGAFPHLEALAFAITTCQISKSSHYLQKIDSDC